MDSVVLVSNEAVWTVREHDQGFQRMADAPSQKDVEEFKAQLIKMSPERIQELLDRGKIAREWKREMAKEIIRRMYQLSASNSAARSALPFKKGRIKVVALTWLFTGAIIAGGFLAAYTFVFKH